MAVNLAVTELDAAGYQTEAVYLEQGIAGFEPFDVSAAYDFSFAGTDGNAITLPATRILSSESVSFGGFSGIVGMPAMVNRITTLDLAAMTGGDIGIDLMGVAFPAELPGDAGHRYSMSLSMVDFPAAGQIEPDDPLPTYAPVPFVETRLRHGNNVSGGSFLIDTGAQLSIISTAIAIELGLDTDGSGAIDTEAIEWIQVGGVGGSTFAPMIIFDRLALSTDQGVDIVWTDIDVLVIDIDVEEGGAIAGIFGCELFTSGWLLAVLGGEPSGYINQVHLDFRNYDADPNNLAGTMYFDLPADFDVVTPGLAGDLNGDWSVDIVDLNMVLIDWGKSGAAISDSRADVSGDGTVGIEDLNTVLIDWGQIAP